MPLEPSIKRTFAFVDGQNLFHAAKAAFGYSFPNFDVKALSQRICDARGWRLDKVCFYTGVPSERDNRKWYRYWNAKLARMGTESISVFQRELMYRRKQVVDSTGRTITVEVPQEKGIDVRLALDIIGLSYRFQFDVALVFSQDQDLSEVADELRMISQTQGRWIKMATAYPVSPIYRNNRGVFSTDWITIDRAAYDACIDTRDRAPTP